VLLVEPDPALRATIALAIGMAALVDSHERFETAREQLLATRYHLVVANVRLQEFNGIHLAYVVQEVDPSARVVVYADESDIGLALDAQRACAFFELIDRIPITVAAYLVPDLPVRDRRDPARFDRRRSARGGRRLWDLHAATPLG
jgi:DNA-binding NtrC family response regulator